jgi:hypothetical protein
MIAKTLVFLTACSTVAAGAEVTGRFTAQEAGTITPAHAAAFETRDPRNPRSRIVEVVLSAQPIDADAAAAALSPHAQAINQEGLKGQDYILVWIRPDGRASMNATFGATMTQFLDATGQGLSIELATNAADRVAARLFTPRPVATLGGETYSVDVTFTAAVARPAPGTALPAGGGDAGRALVALDAALTARRWDRIRAGLAPGTVERFDESYRTAEENIDYAVDVLRAWLPKKRLRVSGGELRGDTATLDVEGEMFPGQKALYLARMVRTGGTWQLQQATSAGMID